MSSLKKIPKILYVENSSKKEIKLPIMLKNYCNNLLLAKDGLNGLKIFEKHNPQLVITDVKIPKLNGIELLKKIRNNNKNTVFIIISEYSNQKYLHEAIELNVHKYIQKPTDLDLIEKKLLETIENTNIKKELSSEKELNTQLQTIINLSSGLSHEINTPLTIMKGNLEILKMGIDDIDDFYDKEILFDDISKIEQNITRIANVVETFQEITDLENLKIEKLNLYRVLIYVLRILYYDVKNIANIKIQNINFSLDTDRDKEKYFIKGNAKKLEFALLSIIKNSIDQFKLKPYSKDNLIDIKIVASDKFISLNITDNAGGIEANMVPKVFKPFQGKKEHKGFGIGLSMVKKIIDEHYYHINLSNYNNGVKVTIVSPMYK